VAALKDPVNSSAVGRGFRPDRSPGDAALAEETDIERLVSRMDEALPDAPGASSAETPLPGIDSMRPRVRLRWVAARRVLAYG
jgi:hypothetical protein